MPRIVVTLPDGSDVTHELTEDLTSVGRVSDNTIQIEDASVSSHHGELIQRDGNYLFKDIGSTNGSRYNGGVVTPDEEIALNHGDNLIFGSIPVRYLVGIEDEGEQQPLPTESEPALAPATTTVAPTNFTNASPFQKTKKKTDVAGILVLIVGIIALLAAGGAIGIVMSTQPPM